MQSPSSNRLPPDTGKFTQEGDRRIRHLPAKLAAHRLFAGATADPMGWALLEHDRIDIAYVTNLNGPIVRSLVTVNDGRFEFDDAFGERGFVMAVHDEDAETVVDLVAWSARDPASFGSLFGAGVLGVDVLLNPASYVASPCMIFQYPLAWLRGKCAGAVILDPKAAKGVLQRAPGPITTETLDHAESLVRSGVIAGHKIHVPAAWVRSA